MEYKFTPCCNEMEKTLKDLQTFEQQGILELNVMPEGLVILRETDDEDEWITRCPHCKALMEDYIHPNY